MFLLLSRYIPSEADRVWMGTQVGIGTGVGVREERGENKLLLLSGQAQFAQNRVD